MDRAKVVEAYREIVGGGEAQAEAAIPGASQDVAVLARLPGYVIRAAALIVYGRNGGKLPIDEWAKEAIAEVGRREQARELSARRQRRRPKRQRPERQSLGRQTPDPDAHEGASFEGQSRDRQLTEEQQRAAWEGQLRRWRANPPPFRFLLDRVDECAAIGNYGAVLDVAEIAAESACGSPQNLPVVARRVVAAYLRMAESLSVIPDITARAQTHMARRWADQRPLPREVQAQLDGIAVLLPDESVFGRTKLSSLLRQVNRPDLAVEAVRRFSGGSAEEAPALTTGAAALADLGRTPEARGWAEKAWQLSHSAPTACVLSRISRLDRNPQIALRWAKEAWKCERNRITARSLAAAAVLMDDSSALAEASGWLGQHPEAEDHPSAYVAVRAGWILLQDGDAASARDVASRVLSSIPGYSPAERLLRRAGAEMSRPSDSAT